MKTDERFRFDHNAGTHKSARGNEASTKTEHHPMENAQTKTRFRLSLGQQKLLPKQDHFCDNSVGPV